MAGKKSLQDKAFEATLATGLKTSPQLSAARGFVQDLMEQDDTVIGAFIHGSAARGDSLDDSDVDLHVVVEGEPPAPAAFWREGVVLDVMYVSTDLMTVDPRDFLDSEQGREELSRGHLVWDIVDSIVILDPDGLVRGYKRVAATLARQPELLKLRAGFVLEDSVATLEEARNAFAEDPLLGFTLLYRAPAPTVRGGAVPLAMGAVLSMAARPLGFRSLFPQFRVAAEDLGFMEMVGWAETAWGLQEASVSRADKSFDLLARLFQSSVKAVEVAVESEDPAAQAAEPYVSETERDRTIGLAKSLVDMGEIQGAIAFALGKSMQLLSFDEFPNPWLQVDNGRPLKVVRAGIEKLLGDPNTEDTATRLDALDALHWTIADLLSG
jgi:predicted nucleotidyltransferase